MPASIADAMRAASGLLSIIAGDTAILSTLERIADALAAALQRGGKVIACGNGGSLCDASHFVEELTGRFRADRPALAAIALNDPGHLTCVANDYGFDEVFSRGVRALGAPGDILLVLSTSGNSENILRAIHAARERGMDVVSLLGRRGGRCLGLASFEVVIPDGPNGEGTTSDRIQEIHMLMLHAIVEGIEGRLFRTDVRP